MRLYELTGAVWYGCENQTAILEQMALMANMAHGKLRIDWSGERNREVFQNPLQLLGEYHEKHKEGQEVQIKTYTRKRKHIMGREPREMEIVIGKNYVTRGEKEELEKAIEGKKSSNARSDLSTRKMQEIFKPLGRRINRLITKSTIARTTKRYPIFPNTFDTVKVQQR